MISLAQVDEETSLAKSAEVDLNKLFRDLKFSSGEELALSAGQALSKVRPCNAQDLHCQAACWEP